MASASLTISCNAVKCSGTFKNGETITGSLSNATATIVSINEDETILSVNNVSGTFIPDDIVEPPGGTSATIISIS